MHNSPLISVVVPAYNAERTILETIASIQKQTLSNFELIVINDGSKDRTLELLQSITDQRLNIFSYKNSGLPVARNRGIFHATGEFISFIDADDLWTPDKLELQLAALQQHAEAGLAYSWTYFMDEEGESLCPCEPIFFEGNVYAELLVNDFLANGSNPLIRRQAIESVGEFDPTLKSCEDWDYYLRLAARWPFAVVPKHQILYRRASSSMSAKVETMKEAALMVLEKAYRAAPPRLQYLRSQSIIDLHKFCADLYLQNSTDISAVSQAGQNLWVAIRLQPKTLLARSTQRLVLKFLLKQLLPPGVASYLLQLFSRTRVTCAPLLQQ